ncbi:hypothetical protein AAHC03_0105 [Spirometra sp. Aus1]
MKRALKAWLGTSQSPPLRLYFRSLECDQGETLETSKVSSIDLSYPNTSETTIPVPDTIGTWSKSSLAGPFLTEVFAGDTHNIVIPEEAGTYEVLKPEQGDDEKDDTLDAVSQMSSDAGAESHSENARWALIHEEVLEDEFLEMGKLAIAYAF